MRRARNFAGDRRGAAYVEFLLAFMPIFTLFMGLLQIAVLYAARIATEHAAARGARSAAVVLDDDPAYYAGEERGFVGGRPASAGELAQAYRRHTGGASGMGVSSRRAAIEIAAMLALVGITPRDPSGGGDGAGDSLERRADHTRRYVRVAILGADGRPATTMGDEDVRVRVTFDYPCAIPFAGPLVCGGMTSEIVAEARLHNHAAAYPYMSERR
jgi:hypothetical protein